VCVYDVRERVCVQETCNGDKHKCRHNKSCSRSQGLGPNPKPETLDSKPGGTRDSEIERAERAMLARCTHQRGEPYNPKPSTLNPKPFADAYDCSR
jgi:hypothetical protein